MKQFAIFLLVCVMSCGIPLAVSANSASQQANTIAQNRIEDLNFLCTELEKRHKNLYHNISKEEFLAEKEKIAAKVNSLSDIEFYFEIKRLVSLVGDAHTNVALTPSAHDYMRPLPIGGTYINGDFYVRAVDKAHEKYLGWQITEINEFPIAEVFNRAAQLNSHENQVILEEGINKDISFIDTLRYLGISKNLTAVNYTLKDPASGLEETTEFLSYEGRDIFDEEIVLWQTKSFMDSMDQKMYFSREINKDAYLIQYNICAEDENYPITEFSKQIQADIDGNEYMKVVVDLRYNGGGNSAILKPVMDMLENEQKEHDFTAFILVGRDTFSSGILNAVELKLRLNGIFVGTPTQGSLNHYGEVKTFDLPNFHAAVRYSTKYFEYDPTYDKDSIYPDIPVTTTYEDVVDGVDREIEAVMNE